MYRCEILRTPICFWFTTLNGVKMLYRKTKVWEECISQRNGKYTAYCVHSYVIEESVYVLMGCSDSNRDAKPFLVQTAQPEF